MKNVHVLPTNKPSRLQLNINNGKLILFDNFQSENESVHLSNQHIYITSDEEIKKDEYYLGDDNHIYNLVTSVNNNGKKIILTTDQDLIYDGVQAIDDEFLEWFVKNPTCEFGKIINDTYTVGEMSKLPLGTRNHKYKIIIPQEEPKQKNQDYIDDCFRVLSSKEPIYEKETLQKAAKNYGWRIKINSFSDPVKANELAESATIDFIEGAKWKAERTYAKEEVRQMVKNAYIMGRKNIFIGAFNDWFNQFKKK